MNNFTNFLSSRIEKISVKKVIEGNNVRYFSSDNDLHCILFSPYREDMFFEDSFSKIYSLSINQDYTICNKKHILIENDTIYLKCIGAKDMIINYDNDKFLSFKDGIITRNLNSDNKLSEKFLIRFFDRFLSN